MSIKHDPFFTGFSRSSEFQFTDPRPVHWRILLRTSVWRPPTDVFETEEAIVVRVEVAGMREEDFSIDLDGQILSIHGIRPDLDERGPFHQMEIRFGEFSSEIELLAPVAASQVTAFYSNGFLRVTLPKAQPRHVPIE
jgi:HSP20 family protein